MVRSSFSDNPVLRVSRPVSACSRCRAAKVKCDGKLPACTACEKAGRESDCSAANDQFARGKERSYVAALELRVEKLERRLAYARARSASLALPENDLSLLPQPTSLRDDRRDSLSLIRAAISRKAARKRENSDVNSLISDFGYLSVNANARDFEATIGNMTFARLVLAASANDPLPEELFLIPKIPTREVAFATIKYYLGHVNVLFPAVRESAFLAKLEELYHQPIPGSQAPYRPNLTDADYWMIYMVLAISSGMQARSRNDQFYADGVHYAARAMHHADGALAPGHIDQIRSLILMTLYSTLDPGHFDSWHLIGITCRAVVDLGFHQDPPHTQNMDATVLDERRTIFYAAYALDRSISMIHARAFSFTDDGVNVAYPTMVGWTYPQHQLLNPPHQPPPAPAASPLPPPPHPALLLFQLRRAQSHWYQTLYQTDISDPLPDPIGFVWRMCADMHDWVTNLPTNLSFDIREKLEMELQYSYVLCIAPSARVPLITTYGRVLIFEYVIAFVNRIVREPVSGLVNAFWHTYHDALRMFFMGSQFVAVLRDPEAADTILNGVHPLPTPLPLPGQSPPPTMPPPADASGTNVSRAIRCIERVCWVMDLHGARWEVAEQLAKGFRTISRHVLDDLWARQASAAAAAAAANKAAQGRLARPQQVQQQSTAGMAPPAMPMAGPPHPHMMSYYAQQPPHLAHPPPHHVTHPPQPYRPQQGRLTPMRYPSSIPPHARQ